MDQEIEQNRQHSESRIRIVEQAKDESIANLTQNLNDIERNSQERAQSQKP